MGSLARNAPDCDSHTANFLAEARSVFDAAVAGKAITSADRDQIAYRFQTLLDEYMSDEKCNAIGTLHDSFDNVPIILRELGNTQANFSYLLL